MSQSPVIELQAKDLTLSGETFCPNPKAGMKVWNTHPRVYLSLKDGHAKCPYCGTEYKVKDGYLAGHGH